MPELICVGCGPGDPELLTVKAVNAIKDAEVIMCPTSKEGKPSMALSVISSLIDESQKQIVNLVFPMTKDKEKLSITWENNAKILAEMVLSGKKVIYLTVGDPYLYSTWIYLHREISIKYPEIKIT
ncbi:MAG: precorrin-2 C(20)-methyltransferase, partial [Nitrosopumilaceae archaeon]